MRLRTNFISFLFSISIFGSNARFITNDDQFVPKELFCMTPVLQNADITIRGRRNVPIVVPPGTRVEVQCRQGYGFGKQHLGKVLVRICNEFGKWSAAAYGIAKRDNFPGSVVNDEFIRCVYEPDYESIFTRIADYHKFVNNLPSFSQFQIDNGATAKSGQEESVLYPTTIMCTANLVPNGAVLAYTGYKRVVEVMEDMTTLYPGNRIRVICDPGYVLTGTEYSFCLTDGSWSDTVGNCIALEFEYPPTTIEPEVIEEMIVELGEVPEDTPNNRPLVVAKNAANRGNAVTTASTVDTDKKLIEIGDSLLVSTQSPETSEITEQVEFLLETNDAFVRSNNLVETSTTTFPEAIEVHPGLFENCGTLPLLKNGLISELGSSMSDSTRNVRCNHGFTLLGSDVVLCGEHGDWIVNSICQTACINSPEIENGFTVVSGIATLTEERKFQCNAGFRVTGPGVARCEDKGTWIVQGECSPAIVKPIPLNDKMDFTVEYMDENLVDSLPRTAVNVTSLAFSHTSMKTFERVRLISQKLSDIYGSYWATVAGPSSVTISGDYMAPYYVKLRQRDVNVVIFKEVCAKRMPHMEGMRTPHPQQDTSEFFFQQNTHSSLANSTKTDALHIVALAFKLFSNKRYEEMADFVRTQFNLAYGGDWLCIVGPSTFDVYYWYEQPLFISIGKADENISISIIHPPICKIF